MKENKYYTVRAVRYGDWDGHSYMIGVFNSKSKAIKASENEEDFRGGKYICEILEWDINKGNDCSMESNHKVINRG